MKYKAGRLCDDGIFRVWFPDEQIFKMVGNCVGIFEETIQDLITKDLWVGVEAQVKDGKFEGIYYYTKEQALAFGTWNKKNAPEWQRQRLFPLRDIYRRGEQDEIQEEASGG
jgi:hypothetical protein